MCILACRNWIISFAYIRISLWIMHFSVHVLFHVVAFHLFFVVYFSFFGLMVQFHRYMVDRSRWLGWATTVAAIRYPMAARIRWNSRRRRGGMGKWPSEGGRVTEGAARGRSWEVFSNLTGSGCSSLAVKASARDHIKLQDMGLDFCWRCGKGEDHLCEQSSSLIPCNFLSCSDFMLWSWGRQIMMC
jgi:hypothetical protein